MTNPLSKPARHTPTVKQVLGDGAGEAEREAFEAWMLKELGRSPMTWPHVAEKYNLPHTADRPGYVSMQDEEMWVGWQARAQLAPTTSGWQDISTAPKVQGFRALIRKDCGEGTLPSVSHAFWLDDGAWYFQDNSSQSVKDWGYRVTHWQAVPSSSLGASPGWMPISTAPKHVEVLVWREDSGSFIAKLTTPGAVITPEEMERQSLEFPEDFEEWFSDAYGWQEGAERPTHWMPLPAPVFQPQHGEEA